MKPIQTFEV